MELGTYLMLGVCVVWFAALVFFLVRDLRGEAVKTELLAKGESPDPFQFSGEKARAEAREGYLADPVLREYFETIEIVPFLHLDGDPSTVKEKE